MSKKVLYIIIAIFIAIIGFFVWKSVTNNEASNTTDENQPSETNVVTNNEGEDKDRENVPEEYIKLNKNDAESATFTFLVPVNAADITGNNIYHCVVNVSARAEADGEQPECKNATKDNKFSISYNPNNRTLVIETTNLSEWGINSGPFKIGCAACISAVKFTNIHTESGLLLKEKLVAVY